MTALDTLDLSTGAVVLHRAAEPDLPERVALLAQLTTDAARTDAHRFYTRLGYGPSHLGFKLPL